MGMVLIYGIIFLILLVIIAIIIYFVLKKNGRPKLGLIIASIILLIVLSCYFTNVIDETNYSKSDVKIDLKLANLYLKDDFEIIKNEVSGFPERHQYTELRITEKDKKRIVSEIKNGKNFKPSNETWILRNKMLRQNGLRNKIVFTNYSYDNQYFRESYYQKEDYVPILTIVALIEKTNILRFSRIED